MVTALVIAVRLLYDRRPWTCWVVCIAQCSGGASFYDHGTSKFHGCDVIKLFFVSCETADIKYKHT